MDFQERFAATDEACREYLFASRWPDGLRCRRCGGEIGAMHRRPPVWQCKGLAQTSVTAMHGTRQPLRLWFWAAYLVATHHPGISAVQLQRQPGIGRHETAWMMLHKLRRAMVAPEREPLRGEIEADEFFLGGFEEGLEGGRQRGEKTLVGVAVEVRGRGSGRLPSWARRRPRARSCTPTAGRATTPCASSATTTDPAANAPSPGEQLLRRVHRAVSNLKAWLHGTPRLALPEYVPAYLDEFVFRHNRRGTPHAAFQALLRAQRPHEPATYRQIIDQAA